MNTVYLDHAAGSFPKAPGVAEAMAEAILHGGGNINRSTYGLSTDTALQVMEVRESLAEFFGCGKIEHVIFTPGATYSINAVLRGVLRRGDHLIISAMEHNAVWRTAKALAEEGVAFSMAECDGEGFIKPDKLAELFCPETRLVMIAHASNVNGVLQDIPTISKLCKSHGVMLALDVSQSAGHVPIDMGAMGVDAICFPGHKGLGGPQGIGGLLISERMAEAIRPSITGGTGSRSASEKMPEEYPDRLEPGTPNLPGIFGLGAALRHLNETALDARREKEIALTKRFLEGLSDCTGIRVTGPWAEKRVGVISVDFLGVDNADAAARLEEEYGILTRCGLHCAPLAHKSLGTYPQGSVRFSLGCSSTESDVDAAVAAVKEIAIINKI